MPNGVSDEFNPIGGYSRDVLREQESLYPEQDDKERDKIAKRRKLEQDIKKIEAASEEFSKDANLDAKKKEDLVASSMDPDVNIQNEYRRLMAEYKIEKEAAKKKKSKVGYLNAMMQALDAVTQYGAQRARGKAMVAGGFQLPQVQRARPIPQIKAPEGPSAKDLSARLQSLKVLKSLAPKPTKGVVVKSVDEKGQPVSRLVDPTTGKEIASYKGAPPKKKDGEYSRDPQSKESLLAQQKLRAVGFDIADDKLMLLSEKDIEKNFGGFIRKSTRPIDIQKEKRYTEKQAWMIEQKDEVSDKQLESITAIENTQNMLKRIRALKNKVDTGKFQEAKFAVGAYTPGERDPNVVALHGLVGTNLADYVKSISGAQVSDQEAARLLRNIPNMGLDDNEFVRQLNEFQKTLDEVLYTRLKNMKEYQGRKVPKTSADFLTSRGKRRGPPKKATVAQIEKYMKSFPNLSAEQAEKVLTKRLNQ